MKRFCRPRLRQPLALIPARRAAFLCMLLLLAAPTAITAALAQTSYRIVAAAESRIAPGNVAFVDTLGKRIVEIDRAGKVVWSWPITAALIAGGDLRSGADLEWIAADDSFLLVIPFRGIFRVNRAGKVIWQHLTAKVSHDADLLANGNVLYVHGWDAPGDAQVYEIDPAHKLVWSWQIKGRVEEAWRVPVPGEPRPSYGHTNGAVRLPDGDTLISVRNFNRVFRVAPSGEVKRLWGPIPRVHEPTLLADGTLIASPHAPRPGSVIAIAGPGNRRVIFANALGIDPIRTVELLHNGNYLLTGGEEIVEINAAGDVVWHAQIYAKAAHGRGEAAAGLGRRGGLERGAAAGGSGYGGGRESGAGRGAGRATSGERGVYKAVWVGRTDRNRK
ncbi:MAG TPA: hypothetical protein VNK52_14700 [Hyphomicrobiaceae bacterium]|nr:hypothetical protein [Hyphomicrobiaceae bacterium]